MSTPKKLRQETKAWIGLRLNDHALPVSVESAIFEWLEVWELGALGFSSHGLRKSLEQHLATATRIDVRNIQHPRRRLYSCWMLGKMLQHCRNLRVISVTMRSIGTPGEEDHIEAKLQNWLAQLIQYNRNTFQRLDDAFNDRLIGSAAIAAMAYCPNLTTFHATGPHFGFRPNRRDYRVGDLETARDIALHFIVQHRSRLTRLDLVATMSCWKRTHSLMGFKDRSSAKPIDAVLQANLSLVHFSASIFRSSTILLLGTHTKLTTLHLDVSEVHDSKMATTYRQLSQELQRLPELTTLTLRVSVLEQADHAIVWNLPNVTDFELTTDLASAKNVLIPIIAPRLITFRTDVRSDPFGAVLENASQLLSYSVLADGPHGFGKEYDDKAPVWKSLQTIVQTHSKRPLQTLRLKRRRQLDGSILQSLVDHWPHIRELDIWCSKTVTETQMWELLWKLPRLEVAYLWQSSDGSQLPPCQEPEPKIAPHLHTLFLQKASDDGIEDHPISFPSLTSLTLDGKCVALSNWDQLLNRMPQLTKLKVEDCALLDLEEPEALNTTRLTEIELCSVSDISTLGVELLVRRSAAHLRKLRITDCRQVDDFLLDLLSSMHPAPALETIVYYAKDEFSDISLNLFCARFASSLVRFWTGSVSSSMHQKCLLEFPNLDLREENETVEE
jgi:hypothetical protein